MPLEPERDIEKTLRDYAKRRWEQAGTPPPMHPATRRMLQGEVARLKKRRPPASSWTQFLWGSWPRILLNSVVALLLVICVLLLPSLTKNKNAAQPQTLLAKNERSSDAEELRRDEAKSAPPAASSIASAPAPSAAPSVTPMVTENRPTPKALAHGNTPVTATTAAGSREMPAAEKDKSSATSSVASTKSSATDGTLRFYSGNSSVTLDKKQQPIPGAVDTLAASAPPAVAPPQPTGSVAAPSVATPPTTALTAGGVVLNDEDKRLVVNGNPTTVTQQFGLENPSSVMLKEAKAPAGPPVLTSFRVEQTGNQLRVIDSDGSIYVGSLQTSADVSGQLFAYDEISAARQTLQKTNGTNEPAQSAGFFFRVTGTNLTLNQPVVFTGNFLADDRAPSTQTDTGSVSGRLGDGGGGLGGAGRARSALGLATNVMSKNELQTVPTTPAFQLSNTRLQGQATIGTNQVPINALPVKP